MLLKDCPVGSFVRLVSFYGDTGWADEHSWWSGYFEVFSGEGGKYVVCNDGDKLEEGDSKEFQFKIVKPAAPSTPNTITLNGKTYKLKPYTEPRLTVIDGVTYEVEEI